MLHTHKSLSPIPIFTHTFFPPPLLFLFHAVPSLRPSDVARGGDRVQSTSLMCNALACVQPQEAHAQLSTAVSQELKSHVGPKKKKKVKYMLSACNSVYLDQAKSFKQLSSPDGENIHV